MSNKKVVPPKGKKTHTEMLIDPSLRGEYMKVRNKKKTALDEEFEAEEDSQARELRDLRIEEMTLRRKAKLAKLKRDIKKLEELPAEPKTGEAPKIP